MFKLLVLSCLLISCLADPFGLPSWLNEAGRRHRHPRGCADRAEGWRACARLTGAETLAPHSQDCSLFFYCRAEGARPACRRCPAGLHFNPALQVCDWPANVDCQPRPPHPRPPRGNGTSPVPTTPDEDATVTSTDSPSSTPEELSTITVETYSSTLASTDLPSTLPASTEPFSTTDDWGWGRK